MTSTDPIATYERAIDVLDTLTGYAARSGITIPKGDAFVVNADRSIAVPVELLARLLGGDPSSDTIAGDRAEDEPCERGTIGCCLHHNGDTPCEAW